MAKHQENEGTPSLFRKTGLLLSSLAAIYFIVFFTARLFKATMPDAPDIDILRLVSIGSCFIIFTLSALDDSLSWLQPLVLLVITPLPMLNHASSMFSLGTFIAAMILLFRLGFFKNHKFYKVLITIAYFYLCEIIIGITSENNVLNIIIPILFMTVFLVFLILVYGDTWIIYLKEPKPSLSLSDLKVTQKEAEYLKALLAGRSIKVIAIDGGVKESTVRNTLARVYKKFNVPDKSALMAKCENYLIIK